MSSMPYVNHRSERQEDKWWNDYLESKKSHPGQKIIDYVHSISASQPEATLWFMTTGGKHGFCKRKATPEEMSKIKDSLSNALSTIVPIEDTDNAVSATIRSLSAVQQRGISNEKKTVMSGHELWEDLYQKYDEGYKHVHYLYNRVDDLKKPQQELEKKHPDTLKSLDSWKQKFERKREEQDNEMASLRLALQKAVEEIKKSPVKAISFELESTRKETTESLMPIFESFNSNLKSSEERFTKQLESSKKSFIQLLEQEKQERIAWMETFEKKMLEDEARREKRMLEAEERFEKEMLAILTPKKKAARQRMLG